MRIKHARNEDNPLQAIERWRIRAGGLAQD
jgi:hypothetical protein